MSVPMMKAACLNAHAGLEHLVYQEVPRPQPTTGGGIGAGPRHRDYTHRGQLVRDLDDRNRRRPPVSHYSWA